MVISVTRYRRMKTQAIRMDSGTAVFPQLLVQSSARHSSFRMHFTRVGLIMYSSLCRLMLEQKGTALKSIAGSANYFLKVITLHQDGMGVLRIEHARPG